MNTSPADHAAMGTAGLRTTEYQAGIDLLLSRSQPAVSARATGDSRPAHEVAGGYIESDMKTTTLAAELAEAIAAAEAAAAAYTKARRKDHADDSLELLRLRSIEAENAVGRLTQ
jgi:hypothetical protein